MSVDVSLFNYINSFVGRWTWLYYFAIFCAKYLGYILVLAIIIFFLINFKKHWLVLFEAIIAASFTRFVLVEIIRGAWFKLRPFAQFNFIPLIHQNAGESSFPSGHASFYFALSTIIFLYNKKAGILFYAASFLIAISRVFVGVHWPSDILAGAIIGVITALIINFIYKKYENNLFRSWRSL